MGFFTGRLAQWTLDVINPVNESPECDWCFSKNILLTEEHGRDRKYSCKECGCKFNTYTELTGKLDYTLQSEGRPSMLHKYNPFLQKPECDWCFSKNISLIKETSRNKDYACKECGCEFKTYTMLKGKLSYTLKKKGDGSLRYKYCQ